jgi:hypothetical protein
MVVVVNDAMVNPNSIARLIGKTRIVLVSNYTFDKGKLQGGTSSYPQDSPLTSVAHILDKRVLVNVS